MQRRLRFVPRECHEIEWKFFQAVVQLFKALACRAVSAVRYRHFHSSHFCLKFFSFLKKVDQHIFFKAQVISKSDHLLERTHSFLCQLPTYSVDYPYSVTTASIENTKLYGSISYAVERMFSHFYKKTLHGARIALRENRTRKLWWFSLLMRSLEPLERCTMW